MDRSTILHLPGLGRFQDPVHNTLIAIPSNQLGANNHLLFIQNLDIDLDVSEDGVVVIGEVGRGIDIVISLRADQRELIGVLVSIVPGSIHDTLHIVVQLKVILLLRVIELQDLLVGYRLGEFVPGTVVQDVDVDHTPILIILPIPAFDMLQTLLLQRKGSLGPIDLANDSQIPLPGTLSNIGETLIVLIIAIPVQKDLVVRDRNGDRMAPNGVHQLICAVHQSDAILIHFGGNQVHRVQVFTVTIVHVLVERVRLLHNITLVNGIPNVKLIDILIIIPSRITLRVFHHRAALPRMIEPPLLVKPNNNVVKLVLFELCDDLEVALSLIVHRAIAAEFLLKPGRYQRQLRIPDRNPLREIVVHHDHTRRVRMRLLRKQRARTQPVRRIFQFSVAFQYDTFFF